MISSPWGPPHVPIQKKIRVSTEKYSCQIKRHLKIKWHQYLCGWNVFSHYIPKLCICLHQLDKWKRVRTEGGNLTDNLFNWAKHRPETGSHSHLTLQLHHPCEMYCIMNSWYWIHYKLEHTASWKGRRKRKHRAIGFRSPTSTWFTKISKFEYIKPVNWMNC